MRAYDPFSYEQHQDVAGLLTRLRLDLARLQDDLGRSYGDLASADARSALNAIDRLRERLHCQLGRDFPSDPDQVSNIRIASVYSGEGGLEHGLAG